MLRNTRTYHLQVRSQDGRVYAWDLKSGKYDIVFSVAESKLLRRGTFRAVNALAISGDSKYLAAATDSGVVVLDYHKKEEVRLLGSVDRCASCVLFSNDSKKVVVAAADGIISYNIADWKSEKINIEVVSCHTLALSPNDEYLIAGDTVAEKEPCKVTIQSLGKPREKWQFECQSAAMNKVAVSKNGKLLATASGDNTVLIWRFDKLISQK